VGIAVLPFVGVRVGNRVDVALTVHVGRRVAVPVGEGVGVEEGVWEIANVTVGTGVSNWFNASFTRWEISSPTADSSRNKSSMMSREMLA